MLLNFRQLEVFRAIMIAKTVSGAAEILHVSQPGISRLLKYMEHKLGISLFERHKGRLIPTPEGEELFKELEPIYQRISDLDITLNRITRPEDQQFQVACTPGLANFVLPRILSKVKNKIQNLQIKLEALPNEELSEYIIQRRVDFALAFYDPDHPLILAEPTISVGMVCVVPKGHELEGRKSVSFSDIAGYDMVTFYPETLLGTKLNKAFQEIDREPKMSVMVRYADDACSMVDQGLGVSVAFDYTVIPERFPGLTAIPIKTSKERLFFLRHNGIALPNNLRKFYQLAKTEIRNLD